MYRKILLVIFIGTFLVSGFMLAKNLIENHISKSIYENAIDDFVIEDGEKDKPPHKNEINHPDIEREPIDPSVPRFDMNISIDFEGLKKVNKDVYAWIMIPETKISYPVMYSNDNDKYLRRSLRGGYNRLGSIFIDARNRKDFSDSNTIVYGHNTTNGTMFGSLHSYKNKDYLANHKFFYIFTEDGMRVYEIYKAYVTDVYDAVYDFNKSRKGNDEIVTLSTCTWSKREQERYIVMGKRITEEDWGARQQTP